MGRRNQQFLGFCPCIDPIPYSRGLRQRRYIRILRRSQLLGLHHDLPLVAGDETAVPRRIGLCLRRPNKNTYEIPGYTGGSLVDQEIRPVQKELAFSSIVSL